MKPLLASIILAGLFSQVSIAQEIRPDLKAPKPDNYQSMRVLLYVPGSSRLLDYADVAEILCCDQGEITFETLDGYIITHQGAFTIMRARSNVKPAPHPLRGPRFYDPK